MLQTDPQSWSETCRGSVTVSVTRFLDRAALWRAVMPSLALKSRWAPPFFRTLMISSTLSRWAANVSGLSRKTSQKQNILYCERYLRWRAGKQQETHPAEARHVNDSNISRRLASNNLWTKASKRTTNLNYLKYQQHGSRLQGHWGCDDTVCFLWYKPPGKRPPAFFCLLGLNFTLNNYSSSHMTPKNQTLHL